MEILISLSAALIGGLLLSRVAKRLKLPAVTAYLVAGLLLGPFCLGALGAGGLGFPSMEAVERLNILSQVALGFIAFTIGNEFRVSQLKAMGRQAIIVGILQAVTATVLLDLALILLHLIRPEVISVSSAITLGAIAAATAPAATLMVVRQYKADGPLTRLLLLVVAIDDAVGLVLFSASFGVAAALESGAISLLTVLVEPLIEIVLSLGLGALAGWVLFWVEKFHADGIRMDAVASMLYLDYGKNDGEWVANEYGGHENLDAIELFHHLNSVFHKRRDGAVLIAEESTAWPEVTGNVDDGGLGFDFKWNMGWMNDFTNYIKQDPLFRKGCHGALTFGMVYAYSEKFVLVLSHDEVVHGKASMLYKMPGTLEQKFANLRLAYGFMTAHPGKKLLFMGQEFGQTREWNEDRSLDWDLLSYDNHRQMQDFSAKLNNFYRSNPALYETDYDPEGFSWVSCEDADHSLVSFMRYSKNSAQKLFVICNFTPVEYKAYKAAVPFFGKYKEIFNSDAAEFGGGGMTNPRVKQSKEGEVDGQEQYIEIALPPLSFVVFSAEETKRKVVEKKEKAKTAKSSKKKGEEIVGADSTAGEIAAAGEDGGEKEVLKTKKSSGNKKTSSSKTKKSAKKSTRGRK